MFGIITSFFVVSAVVVVVVLVVVGLVEFVFFFCVVDEGEHEVVISKVGEGGCFSIMVVLFSMRIGLFSVVFLGVLSLFASFLLLLLLLCVG